MTQQRRTRMKSAVGVLSRIYGKPLEAIPLDPADLGRKFLAAPAAACGIATSTLYSYRSDVRTVLWKTGVTDPPRRGQLQCRAAPLPPDWASLRLGLLDSPDKYLPIWLQRFMGHCADAGIIPDRVGDPTLEAYLDHLTHHRLTREPIRMAKRVAEAWNRAAECVPGWPAARLRAPIRDKNYSFPFSAYPAGFQAEVEEFRRRMESGSGGDGMFAADEEDGL